MKSKTLINNLMKAGFSQQGISLFTDISQGHISSLRTGRMNNLREDAHRRLEAMYNDRSKKSLSMYRRVNKVRK